MATKSVKPTYHDKPIYLDTPTTPAVKPTYVVHVIGSADQFVFADKLQLDLNYMQNQGYELHNIQPHGSMFIIVYWIAA